MDADTPSWLVVTPTLKIPLHELHYRASRSGGPGGQHVNTSSTRIELTWNVATSPSLTDTQRLRLRTNLAARLDAQGQLRLVASASRSQLRNREEVTERFRTLVAAALRVPKRRKPTAPSAAVRAARLEAKRRHSAQKRERRRRADDE
jgi:ribosome-associated protein